MRVVRLLAGAVAWVLAVAGVAGIGCFAIDSAGRQVGSRQDAVDVLAPPRPLPAARRGAQLPEAPPRPPLRTTPVAASTSPHRLGPSATSRSARRSPAAATAQPTAPPPAPSSAPPPASPAPSPSDPPVTAAGQRATSGTFSSAAGVVVVGCAGDAMTDWSVGPADGWAVDAEQLTPGELDARFAGASRQVVEVWATCRDGAPVFSTSSTKAAAG